MKVDSRRNLPDFLIVGAMKAGTSTLAHYLRQHPQIYMPDSELHFFDKDKNFNKGVDWYKEKFEKGKEGQLIGEKTPTYSYLPECPERIADIIPDVQLIWIFRDPVDRAYSNYWHAVNAGIERLSFKEAIEKEERRVENNVFYGYKKRSRYVEQVNRYLEYFSKENMCFLFFKNLIRERDRELARAYEFLNIPQDSPESAKKNKTFRPNSITFQYFIRKFFGRGKFYSFFDRLNHSINLEYPKMEPKVHSNLVKHFESYNHKLFELIDRDPPKTWN